MVSTRCTPTDVWPLTCHLPHHRQPALLYYGKQHIMPFRDNSVKQIGLAKSSPLDFGTDNNFPSLLVSEKGLAPIYKKSIYYFPISYLCLATSQYCILTELRLPTVIRKAKFTNLIKRATSPKMQLAEFRFHTNSYKSYKVHSWHLTDEIWKLFCKFYAYQRGWKTPYSEAFVHLLKFS